VEDTPENRQLVRRILESQNYRVVDAVTALEGIRKAAEINPDLILMDINLPDLDGFTAVTRIRSFPHLRHVPIIALTARSVSDDRERARAIGCDHYLNKPIDIDELLETVERFLATGHQEVEAATPRERYLQEQSLNLIQQLEQKITELEEAYRKLEQLEKLKTDFISIVSHELRTPLTLISSYSQMLNILPAVRDDNGAQEFLAGIRRGTDRLQEIINDMVTIIRLELDSADKKFGPVAMRTLIQTVKQEHDDLAQSRQITLSTQLPEELPVINGDPRQLRSALSRIVHNAIKYTPDGGKVTISASAVMDEHDQQWIEIVVADTGVGIDADKQNVIFDRFGTAEDVMLHSTSKTEFKGSGIGLGLAIAKGVIELHSGKIWVESPGYDPQSNPGSKFFIRLPV
ncbi:MAG: response regulator, partial [Chloroflexi bacterium]